MSSEDNPVDEPSGEYNRGSNSASRIFKEYIDTLEADLAGLQENMDLMNEECRVQLHTEQVEKENKDLVSNINAWRRWGRDSTLEAKIDELRQKVEDVEWYFNQPRLAIERLSNGKWMWDNYPKGSIEEFDTPWEALRSARRAS